MMVHLSQLTNINTLLLTKVLSLFLMHKKTSVQRQDVTWKTLLLTSDLFSDFTPVQAKENFQSHIISLKR